MNYKGRIAVSMADCWSRVYAACFARCGDHGESVKAADQACEEFRRKFYAPLDTDDEE